MSTNQNYLNLESKLYKNCKSLEEKFNLLASFILNNFRMNINDLVCEIEEIEIYYNSPNHKDEYVHKSKDQLTNAKWYFHKYHNGTYKSGTYKGLDITFGNGKDTYGGILIRSIENTNSDEFITGPCNTVNYILKQFDYDEVTELVENMKSLDVFDKKNLFYLTTEEPNEEDEEPNYIFTGPRVGLSLKYPEYLLKEYRYLKQPKQIQKYRSTIISSLYKKGNSEKKIIELTKLSKATITKAIKEFTDSKNLSKEDVKKLKPNQINQIFGANNF